MPICFGLDDLELQHVYLVAAVDTEVGVSFQARLLAIEKGSFDMPWILHFSGKLTLRVSERNIATFFEVLEEL